MNLLTIFDIFLLAVSFFSIYSFSGTSKYIVPLACLFCIFWIQKLEKRIKEEEEAKKRLLQYKLEKHHERMKEKDGAAKTPAATQNNDFETIAPTQNKKAGRLQTPITPQPH